MWRNITDRISRAKHSIKQIMLPILIIYFIRTMLFPTFIDVMILFVLFVIYIGAHLDWY